jgi:hypothetical protein
VQVGFAGSRHLFDDPPSNPAELAALYEEVEQHLAKRLEQLPAEFKLDQNLRLIGISQIACGADMIFTRACRKQKIPQRIFLPQHRDAYLSAVGSNGSPDFTADERKKAESLLADEHIIQERVVSDSPDRTQQFEDVNVEILRVSDIVVCLLHEDSQGKPGGTDQLLERAKLRGTPVLEIRVSLVHGKLVFRKEWHNKEPFHPPRLPEELAVLPVSIAADPLPSRDEYCEPLRKLVSNQAKSHQKVFKYAARIIIVTHILATFLASFALVSHRHGAGEDVSLLILFLLAFEVLSLVIGFGVHLSLRRSRPARLWAISRVTAELTRSLRAIGNRHLYLEHLFRTQLPHRFRPLLRTLSVLHLRSTWPNRNDPWEPDRDQYLLVRIGNETSGQIGYFAKALPADERRLHFCRLIFTCCSLLAIAAAAIKFALICFSSGSESGAAVWPGVLGFFAILLPVIAVGGLSWAAAMDYEARVETFRETLEFLHRQKPLVKQASSVAEFERLLLETETTLLGEIVNWFSRRSTMEVP